MPIREVIRDADESSLRPVATDNSAD